jgi:hypothetical protein
LPPTVSGCDGVCEAELVLPSLVTAMLGERLESCEVLIGLGPLLSSDEREAVPGTVRCLEFCRGGMGATKSPCDRCGCGSWSSQSMPDVEEPCRMDASRRVRSGSPLS